MSQQYDRSLEVGKGHKHYHGSFCPSGAAVSTASGANRGAGFSPSYVSTGVYRVTLLDAFGTAFPFLKLISARAQYQQITADTSPTFCAVGDVNEANGTVDIVVWVEAAGTAAKTNITASGVLRRINFEIVVAYDDIPGAGASA